MNNQSKITVSHIEADAQSHLLSITGHTEPKQDSGAFPLECLPPKMQKLVTELHEGFGYPIDFSAFSMLCVAATCIGNSLRVCKKTGWIEPPILYCALIGRPGTCKTHPLNFAFKPLEDMDKTNYKKFLKEMKEYERQMKLARSKGKEDNTDNADIETPVLKQTIVSDVTMEALCKVLAENPRGICLKMDELIAWVKNMTRYTKGSEEQIAMTIWSYGMIRLNRKFDRGGDCISEPFMCVIGTLQPEVLKELAADSRRQTGFMDRIIAVIPERIKSNRWKDNNGSTLSLQEEWRSIVDELVKRGDERIQQGNTLTVLSEKANEFIDEWQAVNADLKDTMPNNIASAYSKLEIYAIRFSLIFHELNNICEGTHHTKVEKESVERALLLVEYLRKGISRMNKTLDISQLYENTAKLYDELPEQFRKKEGDEIAAKVCGWDQRQMTRFLERYNGSLFLKTDRGKYRRL